MGYYTDFEGSFSLDRPLAEKHRDYLFAFSATRRMKRDAAKAERLPDPVRIAVGLPIGAHGGYFVGGETYSARDDDPSVRDHNSPPAGQPGLWCKWAPSENGGAIEWNGAEKFYDYIEWIEYLLKHFLQPWGYTLNGVVRWRGQDEGDVGSIIISDNHVIISNGPFEPA